MRKLIEYFATNKMIVNVFMVVILLGGLFTASTLKRETYPNVDLMQMNINTVYPGAAPLDVELNVSKKIEDELAKVNGLEKYISVSVENMSMMRVWIDMNEKNPEKIKQEIRDAVDKAEGEFPKEAEKPLVQEIKTDVFPVLHYLVSSESLTEKELREIADNMEAELEDVPGVASVDKRAYRDAEYQVHADMVKMRLRNISLEQIKTSIQGYNIRAGGGSLQSLTNQKSIVTMSQFKNVDEIKNVIIRSNFEGQKVRIKDVADVHDSFKKREIYRRGNERNGILLMVNKKESADIIRTARAVKEKVKEFHAKVNRKYGVKLSNRQILKKIEEIAGYAKQKVKAFTDRKKLEKLLAKLTSFAQKEFSGKAPLSFKKKQRLLDLSNRFQVAISESPTTESLKNNLINYIKVQGKSIADQVNILKVMDLTTNTEKLLDITTTNALIGFVLVFIVLFFALSHRAAFWTAVGIPMALLMSFFGMKLLGFSINVISLFGIITVLGIVVDDGIVVSENIHQKYEQGMTGIQAAIQGAHEMLVPIFGSILTTILAFIPLAMMGGILGQFMFQLPIMVILALLASLIEVYVALPCHLGHGKQIKEQKDGKIVKNLIRGYRFLLRPALKMRYLVVLLFIGLLIFSFRFILPTMKFELFSNKEVDRIYITMEGKRGVNLEEMLSRVKKVEGIVTNVSPYDTEMQAMVSTIGNNAIRQQVVPNQENTGKIEILLVPFADRDRSAAEISVIIRKKLNERPDIVALFKKINVTPHQSGPPVGAPIDVKLVSNNEKLRKIFAEKLKTYLKTVKGVYSIEDDNENTKEEIQLKFNYDKMYQLGVNPAIVASTVRMGFSGQEVTSISRSKEDVTVTVQLKEKYRYNLGLLKKLLIPTSYRGKQIELSQIASFPVVRTQSRIMRYNGKRTTNITANVDRKKNNVGVITRNIIKKLGPELKKYPELRMLIGGEAEKSQESLRDAGKAFIMGLFGIIIILLLIFKSLGQALMVIMVIPFGFIGIIFAFKLHGDPLGFFAMVGGIGLAGVIVNNSIVMVDLINNLSKGIEKTTAKLKEKVIDGGSGRIRAIVLTTITTLAGVLPSVYGFGGSSPMIRPLAMALAYGLIFGTLITLFLTPSLYLIGNDIGKIYRKKFENIKQVKYTLRGTFILGVLSGIMGLLLFRSKNFILAGMILVIYVACLLLIWKRKNIYAAWSLLILEILLRIFLIVMGVIVAKFELIPSLLYSLFPILGLVIWGKLFWSSIMAIKAYKEMNPNNLKMENIN